MIETPQIVKTERIEIAKIHQVVPASEIRNVMGKTLKELKDAILSQGKTITGPWLTHHLKPPAQNFDFEVCFPVSSPIEPQGRVEPGELPATTVARTNYRGGYEGLSEAWAEFTRWIKSQKYMVKDNIWECYVTGPESGLDPAEWTTELNREISGEALHRSKA